MQEYKGTKRVIRYSEQPPLTSEPTENAEHPPWMPQSLLEALAHFPTGKKRNGLIAKMAARFLHFANEGRLRSPDQFNTKGELPNHEHFFAI
jgi:hypothetical protein